MAGGANGQVRRVTMPRGTDRTTPRPHSAIVCAGWPLGVVTTRDTPSSRPGAVRDTRSAGESLGRAAASVFGLLKRTEEAGSREILLVAAQDEYVSPTRTFDVTEV